MASVTPWVHFRSRSRESNRSRGSKRSRSPVDRRRHDKSGALDAKELGFGNTKGISQENLKFFVDTKKKFPNIMDGILASCDEIKLDFDMYAEVNTCKIVLEFLQLLERNSNGKISLRNIKDDADRPDKIKKMSQEIFGNRNKGGSDFGVHKRLFEKSVYYATHDYVPAEPKKVKVVSLEESLTQARGPCPACTNYPNCKQTAVIFTKMLTANFSRCKPFFKIVSKQLSFFSM